MIKVISFDVGGTILKNLTIFLVIWLNCGRKYNEKEKYILMKSYEYFIKIASENKDRFYILNIENLSEKQVMEKIFNIINV